MLKLSSEMVILHLNARQMEYNISQGSEFWWISFILFYFFFPFWQYLSLNSGPDAYQLSHTPALLALVISHTGSYHGSSTSASCISGITSTSTMPG
jgi:hypothetical protein